MGCIQLRQHHAVTRETIRDILDTKKEANDLYDYMTKPLDKDGTTGFMRDDSAEPRKL